MTNKEIAQQLGISAATLSLIINHKPGVSETKRQEVFTELKNRGYAHIIKQTNNLENGDKMRWIVNTTREEIVKLSVIIIILS